MTSSKPYLLRAIFDWIIDNGLTPYVVVDVSVSGLMAPVHLAQDGKLILNIGRSAVCNLTLGEDIVSFSARFAGRSEDVSIPQSAVLAIYAKENGQGMMFTPEDGGSSSEESIGAAGGLKGTGRPNLKIIK